MFGFGEIFMIFFILPGLALYFLPTIIALARRAHNTLGIILVNIFAGWTFIGWVITLVWSLVDRRQVWQPG
jgi:hypothetical protein